MKVFKIVRNKGDGVLRSFNGHWKSDLDRRTIRYIPGDYVRPKIERSALFAFDTLENALAFKAWDNNNAHLEIWEATAEPYAGQFPGVVMSSRLFEDARMDAIVDFWLDGCADYVASAPVGTVACASIRLVKQVL